jgi:hypothetical protein
MITQNNVLFHMFSQTRLELIKPFMIILVRRVNIMNYTELGKLTICYIDSNIVTKLMYFKVHVPLGALYVR